MLKYEVDFTLMDTYNHKTTADTVTLGFVSYVVDAAMAYFGVAPYYEAAKWVYDKIIKPPTSGVSNELVVERNFSGSGVTMMQHYYKQKLDTAQPYYRYGFSRGEILLIVESESGTLDASFDYDRIITIQSRGQPLDMTLISVVFFVDSGFKWIRATNIRKIVTSKWRHVLQIDFDFDEVIFPWFWAEDSYKLDFNLYTALPLIGSASTGYVLANLRLSGYQEESGFLPIPQFEERFS